MKTGKKLTNSFKEIMIPYFLIILLIRAAIIFQEANDV